MTRHAAVRTAFSEALLAVDCFAMDELKGEVRLFGKLLHLVEPVEHGQGLAAGIGTAECILVGLAINQNSRGFIRADGAGATN